MGPQRGQSAKLGWVQWLGTVPLSGDSWTGGRPCTWLPGKLPSENCGAKTRLVQPGVAGYDGQGPARQ
jgi:hypothetical protein